MRNLIVRNVNYALPEGVFAIKARNRKIAGTLEYPEPFCTTYERPRERVLYNKYRDANPFFHFFEALWILGGRQDVRWLGRFVKQINAYTDDGIVFHGAYGKRLRHHHGFDQISRAVDILKQQPDSRQVVLQIWDAPHDLGRKTKDLPCNDLVFLKIRNNKLNMLVSCRSNDMLWGAYGANAVQFSMLQEYIANKVGVDVGQYCQVSDSFHVYTNGPAAKVWERCKLIPLINFPDDPYRGGDVVPFPLGAKNPQWDIDLNKFFLEEEEGQYGTEFFGKVARPMMTAWKAYKNEGVGVSNAAYKECDKIAATDWKLGCKEWLDRRYED